MRQDNSGMVRSTVDKFENDKNQIRNEYEALI